MSIFSLKSSKIHAQVFILFIVVLMFYGAIVNFKSVHIKKASGIPVNNKHLFLSPELLSRLSFTQASNGVYYIQALPTQKPRRALPEEIIRQLLILSLIHQYCYPEEKIKIEYPVQMGRAKKRADVVILGEDKDVHMVVEVKQQVDDDSLEQLKSYVMITGADYGVAVSAHEFICLKKITGNSFTELSDIPLYGGNENFVSKKMPEHAKDIQNWSLMETLLTALQIENFEKIDQTHVKMTIQKHTVSLPLTDLISYKKTQKRFLAFGVVLATLVKPADWLSFIKELLAATPDPVAPPPVEDKWLNKITNWMQTLPPDQDFLSTKRIIDEAIGLSSQNFNQSITRRIANIMRAIGGWQPKQKSINGKNERGYIRTE